MVKVKTLEIFLLCSEEEGSSCLVMVCVWPRERERESAWVKI